jgi:hypothetical protein
MSIKYRVRVSAGAVHGVFFFQYARCTAVND